MASVILLSHLISRAHIWKVSCKAETALIFQIPLLERDYIVIALLSLLRENTSKIVIEGNLCSVHLLSTLESIIDIISAEISTLSAIRSSLLSPMSSEDAKLGDFAEIAQTSRLFPDLLSEVLANLLSALPAKIQIQMLGELIMKDLEEPDHLMTFQGSVCAVHH